jgi:methylglyoxal synthase
MKEYTVLLTWDNEAHVWIASNDEIPIALESGSADALIERVKIAAPEILELNGKEYQNIRFIFKAERIAVVA